MRKSINGLSEIVCEHFQLDPRDKIIFAFCNSNRNRVKLLVWVDDGFWIHFKMGERENMVHGGHMALRWMARNVVIDAESARNIKVT